MHPTVLDRAARRHEGLGGDLAAEDTLALLVGLDAPEDVDLNGFEVKQVDEEFQGRAHPPMFAGHRAGRGGARHQDPNYPAAA